MIHQQADADLIQDMQRQIDVYKEEFKNYNDQINEQKRIIAENSKQVEKYKTSCKDKDRTVRDLQNDNKHMRIRLNEIQKTLQDQTEYIEEKSIEKADEIMGQFHNILELGDEENEKSNHLKSKISYLQDENLKLKELVSELKEKKDEGNLRLDEIQKGDITQDPKYIKILKELAENKSNFIEKEEELKTAKKEIEKLNIVIENLNRELIKNKNIAKEYLIKKEKEVERLKNRIKKSNQQKSGTSYYDGPDDDSLKNKSSEHSMENTKADIPQEFFDNSSENNPESNSECSAVIYYR